MPRGTYKKTISGCNCCPPAAPCPSTCDYFASRTIQVSLGGYSLVLSNGSMTGPDGFTGYGSSTIKSGNDGEYYFWMGCEPRFQLPQEIELRFVWQRWVGGVLHTFGTSASWHCAHGSDPTSFLYYISPSFVTDPHPDGWILQQV